MLRITNRRIWTLIATVACGLGTAATTWAIWPGTLGECYDHIQAGRQVNATWPYPHVCPDRVRAHAPFDVMVANGWRRQNLLGAHHFNEEGTKLTRAGQLKVQWILTQAPPERRQVFVERSLAPGVTEERMQIAQQFANGVLTDGSEALVQDTHIRSEGRAAAVVDRERTHYTDTFESREFYIDASQAESAGAP